MSACLTLKQEDGGGGVIKKKKKNTEACEPSAITKDRAVSSSFSSAIHPHLSPFVVYLGAYTRAPAESITCSSSVRESLLSVSKWIHAPQPLG